MEYFGDIPPVDFCCGAEGVPCDNCEKVDSESAVQLVSRIHEFRIIHDAIGDLPNHGINKV